MEVMEIIRARHSVRQYVHHPIEPEKREELNAYVAQLEKESGLHFHMVYDEPQCFQAPIAHYGRFRGVENYVVISGQKTPQTQEATGYYGEKLVLKAQELGLNTCWVALTRGKCLCEMAPNEKILVVISLGYGATQGVSHRSKKPEDVLKVIGEKPDWVDIGIEAALLAPTAVNQQKFKFVIENGKVTAKALGRGLSRMDLGIVKYHFELVTGQKVD